MEEKQNTVVQLVVVHTVDWNNSYHLFWGLCILLSKWEHQLIYFCFLTSLRNSIICFYDEQTNYGDLACRLFWISKLISLPDSISKSKCYISFPMGKCIVANLLMMEILFVILINFECFLLSLDIDNQYQVLNTFHVLKIESVFLTDFRILSVERTVPNKRAEFSLCEWRHSYTSMK